MTIYVNADGTEVHLGLSEKRIALANPPAGQIYRSNCFFGPARVAMREFSGSTNVLTYIVTDHLGSTSLALDASGVEVARMGYKPWGETRYTSGSSSTDYKFTGQMRLDIGIYFYEARNYDTLTGRFLTPDSIIPNSWYPLAFDRYAYVYNSPIRYIDPSGHDVDCSALDTYCKETLKYEKMAATGDYDFPIDEKTGKELNDGGKEAFKQYVQLRITPGPWTLKYGQITVLVFAALVLAQEFQGLQFASWINNEVKVQKLEHGATHWCATANNQSCTQSPTAILNWIGNAMDVSIDHRGMDPNDYLATDGSFPDLAFKVINSVINPPDQEWTKFENLGNEPGRWANGNYYGPIDGVVLTYGSGDRKWWFLTIYASNHKEWFDMLVP